MADHQLSLVALMFLSVFLLIAVDGTLQAERFDFQPSTSKSNNLCTPQGVFSFAFEFLKSREKLLSSCRL